ncbi:uncharacterized protein (TIGR01319 family) [Dysgonomonas hofstadii]|uniref:Uncharacterized protein (TIGR01319 family) n=1 Tax=Dysgonomonas hofstadii TaxID=637886 RepID=A0A840CJ10_9BACT|nr:methylaspartate mutase accessory protein GlmL [Dysgonomonas hofstadii]MBB4035161.1 uncharacterized protein (TIGR01319 family) [Dysgonomonas hofstadii]
MKYLTVDFGSTYTKLTAIDAENRTIMGTASAFTTIDTDIINGYNTALLKLEQTIGKNHFDQILCCSSAGGGLKMVALGLVPELTAKAAKMAVSSAGAKVIKTYSFEISSAEEKEILGIRPDLVLLCGGTDGGNKEVIIANAGRLKNIPADFSIIVAGNKCASDEIEEIFKDSGKDFIITDNVMPVFNKLNIEPAKQSIRELFIKKIIEAKGLSGVQAMASNEVIPTPLAVMSACELLSKGMETAKGIGDFMAVDLGGATTDVYSMADGKPQMENILEKGLPEPFSKRTVEGDLGMRYSLNSMAESIDFDSLEKQSGIIKNTILDWISQCNKNPDTIAMNAEESIIEELLARSAVEIAVERHCGILESSYSPMGEIFTLTGKDLTGIPYIIGIGGAIINSSNPSFILGGAKYNPGKYNYMKPREPEYLLDKKYIFASMGLLAKADPDLALDIMKKEIIKI